MYLCCLAYSVVTSEANEELVVGSSVGKRGILMSNITCTRSKLIMTEHTGTEDLNAKQNEKIKNKKNISRHLKYFHQKHVKFHTNKQTIVIRYNTTQVLF